MADELPFRWPLPSWLALFCSTSKAPPFFFLDKHFQQDFKTKSFILTWRSRA